LHIHLEHIFCLWLILCLIPLVPSVNANTEYSIPINGRYSAHAIRVQLPQEPGWAHDLLINATIVWNQAQLWYQKNDPATVYEFTESASGSAVVYFGMPKAYAGFAVGWTEYDYVPSSKSTIQSTITYLDPSAFTPSQPNNDTARQYAFRLALHEFGRILGLGSILDGRDIMDPRDTINRAREPPMISILDLYALEVLASGNAPDFVTLPSNIQNQLFDSSIFLTLANPNQLIWISDFHYCVNAGCLPFSTSTTIRRVE
jgi:hypothetical protein